MAPKFTPSAVLAILSQMTVEPILLLSNLSMSIFQVVQQVGLYHVVCQQTYSVSNPEIDCNHLANITFNGEPAENIVQQRVAMWNMAIGFSYLAPALIADIFLGAYGDRHGRKVNMLLGILGFILSMYASLILFSVPLQIPLYVLVLVNVITAFTGFVSITMLSASAYLADTVLDPSALTIRMSLMTVMMSLAGIIGPLITGVTSEVLTSAQGVLLAEGFLVAAFLICMILIKHVPPAKLRRMMLEKQEMHEMKATGGLQKVHPVSPDGPKPLTAPPEEQSNESICLTGWTLLKETWQTYVKPRKGHVRLYLLVIVVVFFLNTVSEGLRATIIILFVQKEPLSWTQETIGYYRSVQGAMSLVGTALGVVVFKRLLRLTDTSVIIIASISHLAELLILAFATRTWMVFLSAVVGCLSMLVIPCVHSFMAQQVAPDEVGKAYTAFGISTSLGFLIGNAMYNPIYSATLSFFPGFVFVFASFVLLLALGGVCWLHFDIYVRGEGGRGFLRSCFATGGSGEDGGSKRP